MCFSDVVVLLPGITGSVLANDRGQERAMAPVVAES